MLVAPVISRRAGLRVVFTIGATCPEIASRLSRHAARVAPSKRLVPRADAAIGDYGSFLLQLDLDIHTCRKIEPCQRLDRFRRRLDDVNQPFVGANLELLA